MSFAIRLAERRWLPDAVVRWGIRRLLMERLHDIRRHPQSLDRFVEQMRQGPIAPLVEKANEQHYEVPSAFFERILGPRLKYSSCIWDTPTTTLAQAEDPMLGLTCERAHLGDCMNILELGCGWGSLSLWVAEHYPQSNVVAVSNSRTQKEYIDAQARRRGLPNVEVVTCDMNRFATDRRFDRVLSVEMFEHMCNWPRLLHRIAGWLRDDGKLFLHIFCHREFAYFFEGDGVSNWMGRHFFSGSMMPAADLLAQCRDDLAEEANWLIDGTHYERTLNAWLERLDRQQDDVLALLTATYGADAAPLHRARWRIFLMACAELFGYRGGTEWRVGHYRLSKNGSLRRDSGV